MNRFGGLILTAVVISVTPAAVYAQCTKQGNNMWTRSAALYLDRARSNTRPEEQRSLYQQALDASLEGTQKEPGSPRGWLFLGQSYLAMGDYVKADEALDQAEQRCPEDKELETVRQNAWVMAYNKGVTALQAGNLDDAIAHMKNADLIFQKRPGARLTLGSLYHRKGDLEGAIAAYRSALEILQGPARKGLNPKQEAEWAEQEEAAAFNLAQLYGATNKNEEAAQAFRDFLARNPDNMTAKTNLAVVLTRAGKVKEASAIYEDLLSNPNLTDREYFIAGVGLFQAEQHEKAGEAFRKTLEKNPYHRDAL